MKRVVRDYMEAFRVSRIKEEYGNNYFGMLYMGIYMLLIVPMAVLTQRMSDKSLAEYYILACLLLFGVYSSQVHPVGMSKLQYLCPMSKQERKAYLLKSYWLKIGVIVAVSAIAVAVLEIMGKLNPVYAILYLLAMTGVAISNSLKNAKRVRTCLEEKKSVLLSSGADIREMEAVIVSIGVVFFLLICVGNQDDMQGMAGIVISLIMLFVEMPLVITLLKRVKPTIEQAMNYENE